jgi:hypothetical protein
MLLCLGIMERIWKYLEEDLGEKDQTGRPSQVEGPQHLEFESASESRSSVDGNCRNKWMSRICQDAASPFFRPLGRVSCGSH